MTQLRIRRKSETAQRSVRSLLPMAAVMAGVLGAGIGATLLTDSGQLAPTEAVEVATPQLGAAFEYLQHAYLRTQTFTLGSQEWVLAAHPVVTHFAPEEMLPAGLSGGWTLCVNTHRGLSALSHKPTGYDRLYVDLGQARYAPLRWKRVP